MAETTKIDKLVPDTSVLIEGIVSRKIANDEILPKVVLIHEAVLAELEHQSNVNKSIGFLGLEEIEKIKALSEEKKFKVQFAGERPGAEEIRHARLGEVDARIRQLAIDENATLLTADRVQATVGRAKNVNVIFIEIEQLTVRLKIEDFFDEKTMSVHIRENSFVYAKKGQPGEWKFLKISEETLDRDKIKEISTEIMEEANIRKDGFIELDRAGSTIAQIGNFRIVITRPPFSDGWEITAVRPVRKLALSDYKLNSRLMQRIDAQAEGVLIAGPPGHGKSTLASALAEYYFEKGKIVKTIEAPRDMQLSEGITQYALSHANSSEINDILLLSRPDYTIFDEIRNTTDFRLFSDLRLSGIGLAGVIHATNPIDAIQRFVGRIELGVIPQVIDTVMFVKNGKIGKVLSLQISVKVPEGMGEADLARPVVSVTDFDTGNAEYELYSYGEETVVIPVMGKSSSVWNLAEKMIAQELKKIVSKIKVKVITENKCRIQVPEDEIAKLIGKEGKRIEEIEEQLGIFVEVEPLSKKEIAKSGDEIKFIASTRKGNIVIEVDGELSGKNAKIYNGEDYIVTTLVGKEGIVKIKKENKTGKTIENAINTKRLRILT